MIFISTLAIDTKDLGELVRFSNENDIPLEFSFTNYEENSQKILAHLNNNFILHNYFPRPLEDFTINLASTDSVIRGKSIDHVLNALRISDQFNLPFYAVHSGFRVDILPTQLGGKFNANGLVEYDRSYEIFKKSLETILAKTARYKTTLLIENNVITEENMNTSEDNPLLMCEGSEFMRLFSDIKDERLGILIDVGHINVSAHALKFDKGAMVEQCAAWTKGYQLSENNGITDDHAAVKDVSWFWPFLSKGLDYYTLEINPLSIPDLREQIKMTEEIVNI